ncbi:MAG: DUF3576 domain-containing protein [Sphingomonadaceae bacterium]|nr:DUF3576 domain-containing protein [Sphingomonadaceae bacterium]
MGRLGRAATGLAAVAALAGCSHHHARGKHVKAVPLAPARLATIGVNAYLWQASLDTIAFMPIATVDSNGGVIVTDWYVNPTTPNERIKVTVAILDTTLRADAVRVTANREQMGPTGWVEVPVRAGTVQKLEETILGRARDLRRASIQG